MLASDTNIPTGFMLLDRPAAAAPTRFELTDRSDAVDGKGFTLLPSDRKADTDAAKPMLFPEDPYGREQSLMDRIDAPRPVSVDQKKDELREAAEQLVSTTFIMPLFDQLRDDPLAANMFHGGQAETIFRRQLDQTLSDRIAGGAGLDIVDAIYNEFSKHAGTGASAVTAEARAAAMKGVDLRG